VRHFFREQKRIRIRQAGEGYPKASIQGRNQAQNAPAGRGKKETLDKMKTCSKCKTNKSIAEFYKNSCHKDGLSSRCQICINNDNKLYREKHKNQGKLRWLKWVKNNRERNHERQQRWRSKNPEKNQEQQKYWEIKNKEHRRKLQRNLREKHKGRYRAYDLKRRSTVRGNLDGRMKVAVRRVLNGKKSGRRWESIIGYDAESLKKHLESNFQEGMSWANKNQWHIDHIVPISFFKYKNSRDQEFQYCWSLDNLRPLWAKENLSKGSKITGE